MKYIFVTLQTIFLISILISIIPIQGKPIDSNLVSRWEIQEWNNDAAVFWWDPPVTTSYFIASTGSYINYTLDSYDPTNFTHPSTGKIEIGNLTVHTTNNKSGEVLALSIYGWFPGLITSASDWNYQIQVAEEVAQGEWTLGNLSTNEFKYNYSGFHRRAINFSYCQDPSVGNQNTTLIYDKETGVLLEGSTEFLDSYILRLKLVYSDLISGSNITPWPLVSVSFAVLGIGLLHKFSLYRKKRY
ncbi:MAG: hypothetical protein ACFE95_19595 [Candidatus Hodarchaeota archaeon]